MTAATQERRGRLEYHSCIAVVCTSCGAHCEHYDDEFTLHFTSIGEALGEITTQGWSVSETATICPTCADDSDTSPTPAALRLCEFCSPPLFSDTAPPDRCLCRDHAVTHVLVPLIPRHHAGVEHHTCVTIQCSDCDDNLGYEGSAPHYPSEADARAAARRAGWMLVGQLLTCERCTNRRACATLGHTWPEHPNFTTAAGLEYRWCLRDCDEYVVNPASDRDQPWL